MKAKEAIIVDTQSAACDGGGGALGHPRVYLSLHGRDAIDCPYCGRRYQRAGAVNPQEQAVSAN